MGRESPRCLLRGAGDLATGVAWRLSRAGWPVIATELAEPLTVRRTVALSSAVRQATIDIEGMVGRRVTTADEAVAVAEAGDIAVLVSPQLPAVEPDVVIDARLAKRNLDTTTEDADLVIALGPGFSAGSDCHAVIETQRGHRLGRVIWTGPAAANTGTPGLVGGKGAERVLRASISGVVRWHVTIGDQVAESQVMGTVGGETIVAPFSGVVRGLIMAGTQAIDGLKIGDVDPRCEPSACWEISDKALAVGGGVVEAVHLWQRR